MPNTWIISDTHFNHTNIITARGLDGQLVRPGFDSVEQMDQQLIENWNSVVKPNDTVWHLGDVVVGSLEERQQWMDQHWHLLNGHKNLCVGNHDDIPFLCSGSWFEEVKLWKMFPEFQLMLTHVPIHSESSRLYGSKGSNLLSEPMQLKNVHGHIHENPSPEGNYRCVCVEQIDYTPIHVEDV